MVSGATGHGAVRRRGLPTRCTTSPLEGVPLLVLGKLATDPYDDREGGGAGLDVMRN